MAQLAVRAVGGYARVRQQFKTPIGRFEGIEETLARMGGNLYMMDAHASSRRPRSISRKSRR
jgi:acyl-CoA dehydrogenase